MDGSDGIVLTLNNLLAMLMINNLSINHSQDFNRSKMYLPTIKDGPKKYLITQIRDTCLSNISKSNTRHWTEKMYLKVRYVV